MRFVESKSMKISLLSNQEGQLSSKERMQRAFLDKDVMAFDIYDNEIIIGFIMVKKFDTNSYFLWNYAIDSSYQNKKYGTRALKEFIIFMREKYDMKVLTTTYLFGNEVAKRVYEKIGFIETDVVDEKDCHEVNMIYHCKK